MPGAFPDPGLPQAVAAWALDPALLMSVMKNRSTPSFVWYSVFFAPWSFVNDKSLSNVFVLILPTCPASVELINNRKPKSRKPAWAA